MYMYNKFEEYLLTLTALGGGGASEAPLDN